MRRRLVPVLVLLGIAACHGREHEVPVRDMPSPDRDAEAAQGAPIAPPEDVAALIKRSEGFYHDFDRNDAARVGQLLADRFALVDSAAFTPREQLLRAVTARAREQYPTILERDWSEESVRFFAGAAVFNGLTRATLLRDKDEAPVAVERYVTQVWVWLDARWQLAHWQIEDTGIDAERAIWNEFFRNSKDFSVKPNQLLVDTVRGRKVGDALDAGMGQGRNAVFLASQGWRVTGVDISDEGLRQAQAAATRLGLRIETVNADLTSWDYGTDRWDLAAFIYTGGVDADTVAKLQTGLRKHGLVVIEYVPRAGARTPPLKQLFASGWKILRDEQVEGEPDFGKAKATIVRFVAEKP